MGTWHVDTGVLAHAGEGLVVVRTSDLETLALEDDAVESHGLGRLIHRAELRTKPRHDSIRFIMVILRCEDTEMKRGADVGPWSNLKEGEVLVLVDLDCKDRVPGGLGQTPQTHLSVEEIHHRLLHRERE